MTSKKELKITLDTKSIEFLKKKGLKQIILDVEEKNEPCLQIFNPKVNFRIDQLKSTSQEKKTNLSTQDYKKISFWLDNGSKKKEIKDISISALISDLFYKKFLKFSSNDTIKLSVKGFFKKRLEIQNIEPILVNTCKI